MQPVADGANRFAADFYARLRGEPGNLFVSPFSLHAALAMTADGANGATRDEMVNALHLPADRTAALFAGDLGRFYTGTGKPYQLSVANALWGQTGYPFRPDFLSRQQDRFGAGLTPLDFKADPEQCRGTINRWVEQKTKNRITDLIPAGAIDEATRLVLTNAIYFKGTWQDQFKPMWTKDAPFRLADGTTKPTPMMTRTATYQYTEADGLQLLQLPYKGGELAMVVVLPATPDGLPAAEAKFTAETLAKWTAALAPHEVVVKLPKFKLDVRTKPVPALKELGIRAAFTRQADFGGMSDDRDGLFISDVLHKAFVAVDEEGTEAAAATAVVMATPAAAPIKRPEPKVFTADRPFLFLIRDVQHGTVLFVGRLTNP
jgi:serpin B